MKDTLTTPYIASGRPVAVLKKGLPTLLKVDCANWPDRFPETPEVVAELTAGDDALTILFHVRGRGLRAQVSEDLGPVYTDDCCELFCRPLGTVDYQNYEINPLGFMTASVRTERKVNVRRRTAEELALIERITPLGREPFADKDGVQEWQVGMRIPYSLLTGGERPEALEANLYKCGDRTALPHYLSWSPIDAPAPDFHRPDCFGLLLFED